MSDPRVTSELVEAEAPPERRHSSVYNWLRDNLFSSRWNTILTVVTLVVVVVFVRGMLAFILSPERRWGVVPANMRLYWTYVYPESQYIRVWVSLGIVVSLVGLTLAAWRVGGKVSASQIAQALYGIGGFVLFLAVLAPSLDFRWRLLAFVVAVGLGALGQAIVVAAAPHSREPRLSTLRVLSVVLVLGVVVLWLLPVAPTTKGPLTVEALLLFVSYRVGVLLRDRVREQALRTALVGLWALSLPVIVLAILRDPAIPWEEVTALDVPWGIGFAIVGAALLRWMAAAGAGEAVRLGAIAVLAVAVFIWTTELAILIKLLATLLAIFTLAAPTFGGSDKARTNVIRAYIVAVLLLTYFVRLGDSESTLEVQTAFIGGLTLTFVLAISGIALSFPLGILAALGRTSSLPIFRLISTGYIEIIRGVPFITILYFGDNVLELFLPGGLRLDSLVKAIIATALFSGAYLAENVRGGLQSIPKGQYEAARALGMTTLQMTVLIVLPQALRAVIPAIVGQIISLFKDTSLVAIIGLTDFLFIANNVVPNNPAWIGTKQENLLWAALVYWVFTFNFSRASLRLERKLGVGER